MHLDSYKLFLITKGTLLQGLRDNYNIVNDYEYILLNWLS